MKSRIQRHGNLTLFLAMQNILKWGLYSLNWLLGAVRPTWPTLVPASRVCVQSTWLSHFMGIEIRPNVKVNYKKQRLHFEYWSLQKKCNDKCGPRSQRTFCLQGIKVLAFLPLTLHCFLKYHWFNFLLRSLGLKTVLVCWELRAVYFYTVAELWKRLHSAKKVCFVLFWGKQPSYPQKLICLCQ